MINAVYIFPPERGQGPCKDRGSMSERFEGCTLQTDEQGRFVVFVT